MKGLTSKRLSITTPSHTSSDIHGFGERERILLFQTFKDTYGKLVNNFNVPFDFTIDQCFLQHLLFSLFHT